MISLGMSILLFLPIFLVVNLVAAMPGRESIRTAVRVGVRHFVYGTVIIFAASALLHFLMVWLLNHPPLW